MEIQVGIGNTQEANLFLRALWAEFRREFGKCAWQYMPYKDGPKKRIFIGFADINRPEGTVEISVTYAERGTIRSISFDHAMDRPVDPRSDLGNLIQRSVKTALGRAGSPERQFYSVKVEGLHVPPRYYLGDSFSFEPVSRRLFTMTCAEVVRTYLLNHSVHHRAILCVYLGMNDVPVPGLYGPSGDD